MNVIKSKEEKGDKAVFCKNLHIFTKADIGGMRSLPSLS